MTRHPQAGADARPKPTRAPIWIECTGGGSPYAQPGPLVNLHLVARIEEFWSAPNKCINVVFYSANGAILGTRLLKGGVTLKQLIGAHEGDRGGAA